MEQRDKGTKHPPQVSPAGEIKWVHLHQPEINNLSSKSQYSITLLMDLNDPKVKEWAKEAKSFKPDAKHFPFKVDEKTGNLEVKFKTNASPDKKPPAIVDSKLQVLPKDTFPARGSTVKIEYAPYSYNAWGGCIVLFLQKVQVIEMVEWKRKVLFEKEDGYIADDMTPDTSLPGWQPQEKPNAETPSNPIDKTPDQSNDNEDSLPF